jgi:hypothetical protein
METPGHLDNIYKGRWQEYYLADGRVYDSREIYWRLIEWEKVVAIVTYIRNKKWMTHAKNPNFKFFVIYRWGGQEWVRGERRKIRQWAVGWSDGQRSFMTDLDFKTGAVVRQYVVDNKEIEGHIHPRVKWRG